MWHGILALLLLTASEAVEAQFRYATNGGTITITGWSGSGAANLPATINGLPVTSTGYGAFYESEEGPWNLTSVTIPASVTNIGYEVFAVCEFLSSVKMTNGVTSIGGEAFYANFNLNSITIPASVTSIRDDAFGTAGGLQSDYFEGNAPTIGSDVFWGPPRQSIICQAPPGGVTSPPIRVFR